MPRPRSRRLPTALGRFPLRRAWRRRYRGVDPTGHNLHPAYNQRVGQHDVDELPDEEQLRAFSKAVLDDLEALEAMLASGAFETKNRRIGAEQEMFLVDDALLPAAIAPALLAREHDERLVAELASFNLEANLSPQ